MFLKRVAVIAFTLALSVQLIACRQKVDYTSTNNFPDSSGSQLQNKDEVNTENDNQNSFGSNQGNENTEVSQSCVHAGGGEYSSKTNANPTPYVETLYKDF